MNGLIKIARRWCSTDYPNSLFLIRLYVRKHFWFQNQSETS